MAEEPALRQRRGNGRTVDDDKRPCLPPTGQVYRLSDELLARPGLSGDEHIHVVRRDLGELGVNATHRRGATDERAKSARSRDSHGLRLRDAKGEPCLSEPEACVRRQVDGAAALDPCLVDERAVLGVQVSDPNAHLGSEQLAMGNTYLGVTHDDLAMVTAPHDARRGAQCRSRPPHKRDPCCFRSSPARGSQSQLTADTPCPPGPRT